MTGRTDAKGPSGLSEQTSGTGASVADAMHQSLAERLEDAHLNCEDDVLARLLMDALLFVRRTGGHPAREPLRRLFAMPGMTLRADLMGNDPEFVIPMEGLHEHLGLAEREFIDLLPGANASCESGGVRDV